MKCDPGVIASPCDLGHRLYHADLVVHPHHRNDCRPFAERAAQRIEVDDPIGFNRQDRLEPPRCTT